MSPTVELSSPPSPGIRPLRSPGGFVLTFDVEEWFHTCMVPDFVDPSLRPPLARELDHLLPETLELLARHGRTATFFVLGEVAEEVPSRVREIADAGHEVASHSYRHVRMGDRCLEEFRSDVLRSRKILEDLTGREITGYRAPEWSLRRVDNPRLPILSELGFRYDSSLAPFLGAGDRRNPRRAVILDWGDQGSLLELPPLTLRSWLRIPAHGWTARLLPPEWIVGAARRHRREEGLAVLVAHPWELSSRMTPGELTGLARFIHEVGRAGFRPVFERIVESLPWTSARDALEGASAWVAEEETRKEALPLSSLNVAAPSGSGDL